VSAVLSGSPPARPPDSIFIFSADGAAGFALPSGGAASGTAKGCRGLGARAAFAFDGPCAPSAPVRILRTSPSLAVIDFTALIPSRRFRGSPLTYPVCRAAFLCAAMPPLFWTTSFSRAASAGVRVPFLDAAAACASSVPSRTAAFDGAAFMACPARSLACSRVSVACTATAACAIRLPAAASRPFTPASASIPSLGPACFPFGDVAFFSPCSLPAATSSLLDRRISAKDAVRPAAAASLASIRSSRFLPGVGSAPRGTSAGAAGSIGS